MGQSVSDMLLRFSSVRSFEPAQESFAVLAQVWAEEPGVTLYQEAVSDHDGVVVLSERQAPIASGQLVSQGMPYYGEDHGQNTANWGGVTGQREVMCHTLDTLVGKYGMPSCIKVDTEGHELSVLQGATRTLSDPEHPSWLVEFHSKFLYAGCIDVLTTAGYELETVRHPHYSDTGPDSMYHHHGWIRAISGGHAPFSYDASDEDIREAVVSAVKIAAADSTLDVEVL
jgi:FkbM family methyltransferase